MDTGTKECPFCGENIKVIAKKCRFCGKFLEGWTRQAVERNIALNWDGKARLCGFDLAGCNFSGVKLTDANLEGSNLENANLATADLETANLKNANLRRANLKEASLWWANLQGADLREADLREAIIADADLTGAKLEGANLETAGWIDFDYFRRSLAQDMIVNLVKLSILKGGLSSEETDLLNTCFTNAKNLEELSRANFTGATYDKKTKWPKNFNPAAAEAILVG